MYSVKRLSMACFGASMLLALVLSIPAAGQVRYRVVRTPKQFGPLGFIYLFDINNENEIVGFRHQSGVPSRGFGWKGDSLHFLPALGGTCTNAHGINDSRHVVGSACLPGDVVQHAVLWVGSNVTDLDTFGTDGSIGLRVNNNNQIAGGYYFNDGRTFGFFWENNTSTELGTLGGTATFPLDMNDSGVVVGHSDISTDPDPRFDLPPFHGFQWAAGTLTDFGQIFGADFNEGSAINEAGTIIGSSDFPGDFFAHAFALDKGVVQDLGTLRHDQTSWGSGINNHGQMVGASGLADPDQLDGPPVYTMLCPCHAVLWQNGTIMDLNTAIPPHWNVIIATAINDQGVILAIGSKDNGAFVKVVLEPIAGSAPSTGAKQRRKISSTPTRLGPERIYREGHGEVLVER